MNWIAQQNVQRQGWMAERIGRYQRVQQLGIWQQAIQAGQHRLPGFGGGSLERFS